MTYPNKEVTENDEDKSYNPLLYLKSFAVTKLNPRYGGRRQFASAVYGALLFLPHRLSQKFRRPRYPFLCNRVRIPDRLYQS